MHSTRALVQFAFDAIMVIKKYRFMFCKPMDYINWKLMWASVLSNVKNYFLDTKIFTVLTYPNQHSVDTSHILLITPAQINTS